MGPVCAQVPYYMFVHHRHKMETMTSVWFFPVVPGVVAALSAAIVGKVVDPRSAAQVRRPQVSAHCHSESWETRHMQHYASMKGVFTAECLTSRQAFDIIKMCSTLWPCMRAGI